MACSGFQNFFMPPYLWTEFGGKVIGMVLVADLKKVIVGSSVSHIGFSVFLISFRTKPTGKILHLNHPCLSSSAMFLAVYYFYLYSNSRNLVINIGIIRLSPVISFF